MKRHLPKQLSMILCFLMIFSTFTPAFGATGSNDYENHWAKTSIQSAMAAGITTGYPDGSFKPDNSITRAEFFAIVNNAFKFNAASAKVYNDVPMNAWYAPVISKADSAGYITGYPDGGIHPESNITRQEAAVIMSKVKALAPSTANVSFTDAASIAEWSMPAVRSVAAAKIMNGYPDGTFKPGMQIKRAEALVTVMNSLLYTGQPPQGVPTPTPVGDVTYNSGTYGPATGSETVSGNAVIASAGAHLRNTVITGDLTISENVGEGEVTLTNVTVRGMTHVFGGGDGSVDFINVTAGTVHVLKDDGAVRLVLSGSTTIDEVSVESDVILEGADLNEEGGVDSITVEDTADGVTVSLMDIDCDSITIEADDVVLDIDEDSTVAELIVNGENLEVNGEGAITNAEINANGADFETEPDDWTTADGIDDPSITPRRSGGGGGGGGGGGSTRTAISAIGDITGNAQVGAVLTAGATTPSNATVTYQWQIADAADGTYTNIAGATNATYTPVGADLGKFIKVTVTGTGNYTGTQTSAATVAVVAGPISTAAIAGVTAPVAGAAPVDTIAETDAYTATIAWMPDDAAFAEGTAYTATITLTPKAGYVLAGIPENFFTVAGATATNAADSGVITAVFPETGAGDVVINTPAIAGVAKPAAGETPVTTVTETDAYTGTVAWEPADATFEAGKDYTATITLTPKAGYTLIGVGENFFTVEGATATNAADSGVITAVFTADAAADWTYEAVGAGIRITAYNGPAGDVVIPADFEGDPVTEIGDSVFEGKAITGVTIPATVTNIRQFAFRNCASLTAVEIPDGVTTIGQQAFRNCGQLASVTLPNSVTSIGIGAFSGCGSLTSITIPDSITAINGQMFLSTPLESVTLPDTLTSIGEEAFAGTALTSVVLPDGLTTIVDFAFNGAPLTSVTIGAGVTIGADAFPGGDALKTLYDEAAGGAGTYTYDGTAWTKQ